MLKDCHSVLIVEDDYDIRTTFSDLLEMEGYRVLSSSNGQEALNILATLPKNQRPALVLLDMMMPIMNGSEFLEVIRNDDSYKPIPIVIVSAQALPEHLVGVTEFIQKPLDLYKLLEITRKHCVIDPA